ncbi:MAG: T9SS C-terminal target domain-containing protein [Flavobacteriia bacterium]|nr:T9SS C-terminal target domain-containing protein [Flavobacteriia bacterium]
MKKFFTLLALVYGGFLMAQGNCSDLFISEYVEGWSNNKALEIYNPTNQSINLSGYFVVRYSNGASSATVANAVQLSGIIAAHDVYVGVIDQRDSLGTGQNAPVWDSLQAKADGFYCSNYNVSNAWYWNGNDAVVLAKGTLPANAATVINPANVPGLVILDIFGKIGENPANSTGSSAGNDGAWSTTFPYNNGQGVLVTKDHSMIRKASIQNGVSTQVAFFNPLLEWDTIPAVIVRLDQNGNPVLGQSGNPILDGNWNSLGFHSCQCGPASVNEVEEAAYSIYPNPSNGTFYINNTASIKHFQVINAFGQELFTKEVNSTSLVTFQIEEPRGVYFVRVTTKDGKTETRKIIIK